MPNSPSIQPTVQVAPEHKGLAFLLTKSYKEGMSAEALFDATRGVWKSVPKHDASFRYAFATHKGVVKEVYQINQWVAAGTQPYTTRSLEGMNLTNRWEFIGRPAPDIIRHSYVGKKIDMARSYGRPFIPVGG